MIRLEHWGCPWSREPDGHVAVRPFGGMKVQRTWFAADKTGFHMLHALFQTSLKYDEISATTSGSSRSCWSTTAACQGVVAIELATGEVRAITAKAVILCTGGCGKIFPFTTNAAIKNGDGMALAYRAGVPLKDMEFVQYHPTGLPFTGILITEAARAEGGLLLNKDGYRYLQDYNLGKPEPKPVLRSMELGPRDRLSQAFVKEQEKGRTIEGPYGALRPPGRPPPGREDHRQEDPVRPRAVPEVREHRPGEGDDPGAARRPLHDGRRLAPTSGATPLPGLYAAGEAACVSINGANRLGSNSLTELLVFGARAGEAAAAFAARPGDRAGGRPPRPRTRSRRLRGPLLRSSRGRSDRHPSPGDARP